MERDHRYDDIIHLSRPELPGHPRMGMIDRAAQFSPFAALTGYEAAIEEAARLTDEKIETGEEQLAALNEKLHLLQWHLRERPIVRVTCFQKDARKAGGAYITLTGRLKKLDETARQLKLENGAVVDFGDVLELESEIFPAKFGEG
ncbi:MAG: hypothetical protein IJ189_05590 [Clostridia bacterium]|nr:hypothetical protein [Clostridia bacterium]